MQHLFNKIVKLFRYTQDKYVQRITYMLDAAAQQNTGNPFPTTPLGRRNTSVAKSRQPLTVRMAASVDDVLRVQRLRAEAFAPAFGMTFADGLDQDRFDVYCAHLMVFDGARLVATTRLLDRERACLAGGFYSEQEFDLRTALQMTPGNVMEIGRTCVAPNYSSLRAIQTLWQSVAEVANEWQANTLIGCASIPLSGDCQGWLDNLPQAQRLELNVKARQPLPSPTSDAPPELPTLLKTYLRMNAKLGTEACYDPAFNCADVLIWLSFAQMDAKYRERFVD